MSCSILEKTMRWISCSAIALTALIAALGSAGGSRAQEPVVKSGSVVKIKARLEHTGPGKDVIVLRFDVEKGWHLYANPVGNEDLAPAETKVRILSKEAAKVQVAYPAGTECEIAGTKWRIYQGTFEIRATVEREAGAAGPLEAEVRLQAVDGNSCLLPELVRVPLPEGQAKKSER
jgi:DsbC/DsbD-like thiol-disulfide interchange protein